MNMSFLVFPPNVAGRVVIIVFDLVIVAVLLGLIALIASAGIQSWRHRGKWGELLQEARQRANRQGQTAYWGMRSMVRWPRILKISHYHRQLLGYTCLNIGNWLIGRTYRNLKIDDDVRQDYAMAKRARHVLAALPDPPDKKTRRRIEELVEEQTRLIAELDTPRIFMKRVNSRRDDLQEELYHVRRELRRLDPSKIDQTYYLDHEGESSE